MFLADVAADIGITSHPGGAPPLLDPSSSASPWLEIACGLLGWPLKPFEKCHKYDLLKSNKGTCHKVLTRFKAPALARPGSHLEL